MDSCAQHLQALSPYTQETASTPPPQSCSLASKVAKPRPGFQDSQQDKDIAGLLFPGQAQGLPPVTRAEWEEQARVHVDSPASGWEGCQRLHGKARVLKFPANAQLHSPWCSRVLRPSAMCEELTSMGLFVQVL